MRDSALKQPAPDVKSRPKDAGNELMRDSALKPATLRRTQPPKRRAGEMDNVPVGGGNLN
jgi:hypothetical protein